MCECISKVNADLAQHNTEIVSTLFQGWAVIETMKKDTKVRKKPVVVVATYCPFCGVEYQKRPTAQPTEAQP
ncbi:hypothetical protein [Roseomonas xinghualingensis]|uniref:hypothetical protein n=1 Tax=Roseomonas xinghualingensis TaxID=2986475 RepID=UPI0021F1895F|nr:hypothetical protein [Roseomonas sp. SXEYE001]MCV4207535.1 hypothetical protein [Roseomonas sp. SXEYE001]